MIKFYCDEHIARDVVKGLAQHGYEAILATDIGMVSKDDDSEHLPYATENRMVMVTFDRPFAGRTMSKTEHGGLICLSEDIRHNIGRIIQVLIKFAETHPADSTSGQVFWLK